jgi:hypothetical protein
MNMLVASVLGTKGDVSKGQLNNGDSCSVPGLAAPSNVKAPCRIDLGLRTRSMAKRVCLSAKRLAHAIFSPTLTLEPVK